MVAFRCSSSCCFNTVVSHTKSMRPPAALLPPSPGARDHSIRCLVYRQSLPRSRGSRRATDAAPVTRNDSLELNGLKLPCLVSCALLSASTARCGSGEAGFCCSGAIAECMGGAAVFWWCAQLMIDKIGCCSPGCGCSAWSFALPSTVDPSLCAGQDPAGCKSQANRVHDFDVDVREASSQPSTREPQQR